ncbi:Bgt-51700 [Blumeria graminis f. sp. tritici]|uniref:Bgt-51700 n=1 Tax=Blumeria graminis f. sp. tritici TaxID=62690 RepID=A0A9X9MET9_BLUGR|nr:Bgt-51700 [Blumeria graminis f. sp. tritici]
MSRCDCPSKWWKTSISIKYLRRDH